MVSLPGDSVKNEICICGITMLELTTCSSAPAFILSHVCKHYCDFSDCCCLATALLLLYWKLSSYCCRTTGIRLSFCGLLREQKHQNKETPPQSGSSHIVCPIVCNANLIQLSSEDSYSMTVYQVWTLWQCAARCEQNLTTRTHYGITNYCPFKDIAQA